MLITLTPATAEPVTLAEAKAHLRVIHDSDDGLIASQITAAREVVEHHTGRALVVASYRWAARDSVDRISALPLWPVSEVSAVSYLDSDAARQTLAASDYTVDLDRSTVTLDSLTYRRGLNIEFTTDPAVIDEALKSAIKLRVEAEYQGNAADAKAMIEAAERIESRFRVNLGV